jgi:hypothetical protein
VNRISFIKKERVILGMMPPTPPIEYISGRRDIRNCIIQAYFIEDKTKA